MRVFTRNGTSSVLKGPLLTLSINLHGIHEDLSLVQQLSYLSVTKCTTRAVIGQFSKLYSTVRPTDSLILS